MSQFPVLNGNWVDLVILLIFAFYIIDGVRRGFILGLFDLLIFILSFVFAVEFYNLGSKFFSANFNLTRGLANAMGFLFIGFLSEVVISIIIHKLINYLPQNWRDRKANRFLGVLPAIGNTAIISAFILTFIVILPVQGGIKSAIINSKIGGALVSKTQGIEKRLNLVFGGAIEESLTFLTVRPESSELVDLKFTQTDLAVDEKAEQKMFELVNKERISVGLSSLQFEDGPLQEIARNHAKNMFSQGFFSHYSPEGDSPFDRMEKAKISYFSAGENLALAPSVLLAHQGLMNSPGHRANILAPDFGKIGIGVIDGGIYGKMFVQEFTD